MTLFLIGWSLFTVGCGGGGGGTTVPDDNAAPVAEAGSDLAVNPGVAVVLDGSASSDSDGEIVSFQWDQVSGDTVDLAGADTATPGFVAPAGGSASKALAFQLTVRDDDGAENTDAVTVTVNGLPTVDAGEDQAVYGGQEVTLSGTAADSDGTITAHSWEQTGGGTVDLVGAATASASFTAPSTTGTLTFQYTVTDNQGEQQSDTVSVYVSRILFSDGFDNASSLDSWAVVNDAGNTPDWEVVSGTLFQWNNVDSSEFEASYHLGTFVYLDDPDFTASSAFQLTVDVTPRFNNIVDEREGNDVGIMFPYTRASDTYYRLSMNARFGFTRLEKHDSGGFSTLAVNSIGYVDGLPMQFRIEVMDDTILVFIDDDLLFAESGLTISPGSVALYCQDRVSFDNVVIADNSLLPMVGISVPLAHSVLPALDAGGVLTVQAVAVNPPEGTRVFFSLDGGPETAAVVSGSIYSAQFGGVENGEHDLSAVLRDASGMAVHWDVNTPVGVGGDYIIAVGDSITNGIGDENPNNNDSADGRIVATNGFGAQLADALTATRGLPQIVFNEGIPGLKSTDLDGAPIDSILERHPDANSMLLLIGTNDSSAGTPDTTFDDRVRNIAATALTDVDRVYVAKIMPRYTAAGGWEATYNGRISLYNERIAAITDDVADDNILPGPDFWAVFLDQYDTLYDAAGLHPNDAGYQAMAAGWHTVLTSP